MDCHFSDSGCHLKEKTEPLHCFGMLRGLHSNKFLILHLDVLFHVQKSKQNLCTIQKIKFTFHSLASLIAACFIMTQISIFSTYLKSTCSL